MPFDLKKDYSENGNPPPCQAKRNGIKILEGPLRYRKEAPAFFEPFCLAAELQRLRQVGMNCGCEYTSFPLFRDLGPYSRFRHSVSAARIVWDFSEDPVQTLAALFHDVATPTFAHSVDFLRGDYLLQEATETGTEQIIRSSREISFLLSELGIDPGLVVDYHCYPLADNPSPRLSADRLEYTLGNLENFAFRSRAEIQAYYDALLVVQNEHGEPELAFRDGETALAFGLDALRCSRVYVSDEDRYSMQMLSELLGKAIRLGVLRDEDLYSTEPEVINKLLADPETAADWTEFRALHEMIRSEADAPTDRRRVIPAKKRYIDPLIAEKGRLSRIYPDFAKALESFLSEPQDHWICAK